MRKSFDGLMAIIRDKYELDPYANALYLFCGRDKRKIKALHFDKDGFVLLQKRLDGSGRFQWPANAGEARQLTRQQFRWLTEVDLCQYFEHKKLKGYADFFNSSSSFCCGVI